MAGFTLFLLQLLALRPSTCLVSGHPSYSNQSSQKWIKAKDRRRVTGRALTTVECADGCADDLEETDGFTDEHKRCNAVEIERLVL